MGEYFTVVNLDKGEYVFIPPAKLCEWLWNEHSKVLFWLTVKVKDERYPTMGRWAGDRVVVVGDYDPEYNKIMEGKRDISIMVLDDLIRFYDNAGFGEIAEHLRVVREILSSVREDSEIFKDPTIKIIG